MLKKNLTKKETKSFSVVSSKHTFFKGCSKILSLGKESEIKNEQVKSMRRRSIELVKLNKDEKLKKNPKNKDERNIMLNQITRNIIAGEQNLNNPNTFYNELFTSIIQNKNTGSQSSVKRNTQNRNSIINRINKKKSLFKANALKNTSLNK
jgi:hypothetical protein